MEDLSGAKSVEITISSDGKTVWVNTEYGCVLRAQRIEQLILKDERKK
jgi:hypothetical protein